jgi:hypothetical protein
LASYTLAFALQPRKEHGKTSFRVAASKEGKRKEERVREGGREEERMKRKGEMIIVMMIIIMITIIVMK